MAGRGWNWNAFALSQQDLRGKTREICSTATILQMELETSAVPVYARTVCVGEHVLVTSFRRDRNARPDPRQTTLQVQEELISRLPIEIYLLLWPDTGPAGRILGNIGALPFIN